MLLFLHQLADSPICTKRIDIPAFARYNQKKTTKDGFFMDKRALRRQISAQKAALTQQQINRASETLAQLLRAHPLYRAANALYAYVSYNQEVRTLPLIARALADGKRVAVPKVYGETMRFLWLDDLSRLAPGAYGIPEPVFDEPEADDPTALVLMPGLAFDAQGHRLGYGGGFYDRFLQREPHPTIALCYDFQLLSELQVEAHDIPVDAVLSAPV